MVPYEPGALIEWVVVLGLVRSSSRIEHRVVEEAGSTVSGRVPIREWSSVADPRDQSAVKVNGRAIVAEVGAGDGQIVGDDVRPAGEIVPEGDLDRRAFLANEYPAQVRIILTSEEPSRIEAAQRRWTQRWNYARILELADVDGVVRDTSYGRRREIRRSYANRADAAQIGSEERNSGWGLGESICHISEEPPRQTRSYRRGGRHSDKLPFCNRHDFPPKAT